MYLDQRFSSGFMENLKHRILKTENKSQLWQPQLFTLLSHPNFGRGLTLLRIALDKK